jgi:hypothetical protein
LSGEESNFAVCGGMLGHIIDHDESVLATVAEMFRHCEAGKRGDPLQPRDGRAASYFPAQN